VMEYIYYPGCSLKATSKAYFESINTISAPLGVNFKELEDWNCCGASLYMGINEMNSFALCARNLALAEKEGKDMAIPCSGCYTMFRKTNQYLKDYPEIKEKIHKVLDEVGLSYNGNVKVRHLAEIIINDVGLEKISGLVKRRLEGLNVACYYGCLMVRPKGGVEDTENPKSLDRLVTALGANPVYFPAKVRCCGGTLVGLGEDIGLRMVRNLLICAKDNKADLIIVTCPLCHMNIDVYQPRVNKEFNLGFSIPVLYFTQLMGIAFGLDKNSLGFKSLIVPAEPVVSKYL
jgi:heterodisulfide reductase subunit B